MLWISALKMFHEYNQEHVQVQACVAGYQIRDSSCVGAPASDLVHTAAHWQASRRAAAAAAAAAGLGPRCRQQRKRAASRSDCSKSRCRSCALLASSPALRHIQFLKKHMRISAEDAPAGVHGAAAAPAVIALPHTGISLRGKSQAGGSESPAPQPAAIESITAGDGDQTAAAPSAGEALVQSATPADEQSPSKHNRTAAGTHLHLIAMSPC